MWFSVYNIMSYVIELHSLDYNEYELTGSYKVVMTCGNGLILV